MEREIKFRAKRLNSREWVYGDYLHHATLPAIMDKTGSLIGIIPETVGQFTGVPDTAGQEIFEGDIVKHVFFNELLNKTTCFAVVTWNRWNWSLFTFGGNYYKPLDSPTLNNCDCVGNIFDNPELLEQ